MADIAAREKISKKLFRPFYWTFAMTVLAGTVVLIAQSKISLQVSIPS